MNEIKKGAVFISDCHRRESREELYKFLTAVKNGEIEVSQLFLMGDIFDLLVGGVSYSLKHNERYIKLLNDLSEDIKIYYFEGNHDFNLKAVFPKIEVYSIKEQPRIFRAGDKKIALLHGDRIAPLSYAVYTFFIRSKPVLFVLNIIDSLFGGYISEKILKSQKSKKICKKIKNFDAIVSKRLKSVDFKEIDTVIEGHFHQDVSINDFGKNYINLPSFACNKSFFIVQSVNEFKMIKSCLL